MSTSSDNITGIVATNFAVSAGATLAKYIGITSGIVNVTFKLLSGGTLEILGAAGSTKTAGGTLIMGGSTQPLTSLAALNGTGYMVQNEVLSFDGPLSLYFNSLSGTCIIHMLQARNASH